ncbi:MAG: hypothetical protein IPO93_15160 [Actinobacteria bacterium]|nr:hypothetical protein [Actinomycetota bacterium]
MARSTFTRPFAVALSALMLAWGLGTVVVPPAVAMPSGQLGAWGQGAVGQLGNGGTTSSPVAVSVDSTGVLAGKTIVQVDAGNLFACAVTSDGLLSRAGGSTPSVNWASERRGTSPPLRP